MLNINVMQLRPPITPPTIDGAQDPRDRIHFRHPAYPDTAQDLLCLVATDTNHAGAPGIDYDVALVACGIVAGNKWTNSRFATRQVEPGLGLGLVADHHLDLVDRPPDGLLVAGVEYFFIPNTDSKMERYPVLPSFDHWRFPHANMPLPWSDLDIPLTRPVQKQRDAVVPRDVRCRLTGSWNDDATEIAHLVPAAAGLWFQSNMMSKSVALPLPLFCSCD